MADANGDGQVHLSELRNLLEGESGKAFLKLITGSGHAPLSAEALFAALDANEDGTVSSEEFMAYLAKEHGARAQATSATFVSWDWCRLLTAFRSGRLLWCVSAALPLSLLLSTWVRNMK